MKTGKKPIGLVWRSSIWFVTLVVGVGVGVDLGVYSLIVPVIPFRLEQLGYSQVSSKTSYLLLAYSAGLILSTPPIAALSEKFGGMRRSPLLIGLLFLALSQVMFMLAPNYAVMAVARFLQGISGSVVWVVGLAVLCDTVPERSVGQQLGLAMTGVSVGFSAGPPIGGALYQNLGFNAPFIFGIILTMVDFIGRLFIIERKDALEWGHDPWGKTSTSSSVEENGAVIPADTDANAHSTGGTEPSEKAEANPDHALSRRASAVPSTGAAAGVDAEVINPASATSAPRRSLTNWGVLRALMNSPRAIASVVMTLIYGIVLTSQEPTLTLRLSAIWGLSSQKVGIVYLAAVVPTIFSGAIVGYISDRKGPEWICFSFLALSIPWWMILSIKESLALFIVALAFGTFFLSGTIAPLTSELAATSRSTEGVGYAHVFGAWNTAYCIGSAIGPILGGQIYDHAQRGWLVLCALQTSMVFVAAVVSASFTGERPLVGRLARLVRGKNVVLE